MRIRRAAVGVLCAIAAAVLLLRDWHAIPAGGVRASPVVDSRRSPAASVAQRATGESSPGPSLSGSPQEKRAPRMLVPTVVVASDAGQPRGVAEVSLLSADGDLVARREAPLGTPIQFDPVPWNDYRVQAEEGDLVGSAHVVLDGSTRVLLHAGEPVRVRVFSSPGIALDDATVLLRRGVLLVRLRAAGHGEYLGRVAAGEHILVVHHATEGASRPVTMQIPEDEEEAVILRGEPVTRRRFMLVDEDSTALQGWFRWTIDSSLTHPCGPDPTTIGWPPAPEGCDVLVGAPGHAARSLPPPDGTDVQRVALRRVPSDRVVVLDGAGAPIPGVAVGWAPRVPKGFPDFSWSCASAGGTALVPRSPSGGVLRISAAGFRTLLVERAPSAQAGGYAYRLVPDVPIEVVIGSEPLEGCWLRVEQRDPDGHVLWDGEYAVDGRVVSVTGSPAGAKRGSLTGTDGKPLIGWFPIHDPP